jgi:hypothetical protein
MSYLSIIRFGVRVKVVADVEAEDGVVGVRCSCAWLWIWMRVGLWFVDVLGCVEFYERSSPEGKGSWVYYML